MTSTNSDDYSEHWRWKLIRAIGWRLHKHHIKQWAFIYLAACRDMSSSCGSLRCINYSKPADGNDFSLSLTIHEASKRRWKEISRTVPMKLFTKSRVLCFLSCFCENLLVATNDCWSLSHGKKAHIHCFIIFTRNKGTFSLSLSLFFLLSTVLRYFLVFCNFLFLQHWLHFSSSSSSAAAAPKSINN